MTIWRMRIGTNTLGLCNTHCFSTAKMVAQMHLNVMRTCLVFFLL
jgi:hypothetical protein